MSKHHGPEARQYGMTTPDRLISIAELGAAEQEWFMVHGIRTTTSRVIGRDTRGAMDEAETLSVTAALGLMANDSFVPLEIEIQMFDLGQNYTGWINAAEFRGKLSAAAEDGDDAVYAYFATVFPRFDLGRHLQNLAAWKRTHPATDPQPTNPVKGSHPTSGV